MWFVLESESMTVASGLEPRCPINQNQRIIDPTFLAEFSRKHRGDRGGSRRIQPDVEMLVCVGIDNSVQSISLVIELDHGFVNRTGIRVNAFERL